VLATVVSQAATIHTAVRVISATIAGFLSRSRGT